MTHLFAAGLACKQVRGIGLQQTDTYNVLITMSDKTSVVISEHLHVHTTHVSNLQAIGLSVRFVSLKQLL